MIVINGAGDHALEAYNVLNDLGYRNDIYFFDEDLNTIGEKHGYSTMVNLHTLREEVIGVLGVGTPHREFIERSNKYIDKWMIVVHPSAHLCNDIMLGTGVVIKQRVTLMPYAKLGNFVQINVGALIGHHAEIGDYSCIGPTAQIMGRVSIGEECYIGVNAIILEKLSIADKVTIGAGAVVVKDITEPGTTWAGVPAKPLKRANLTGRG